MQNYIQIIMLVLVCAMFYLILIIPESRRRKKFKAMIESLKVNDNVLTRGGIVGTIVNIKDNYIILQTGPDKMRIKLSKNGISSIIAAEEEAQTK